MHIEKFKPTAVRAVIDHDERTHLSTLMRDNIDESRTNLNEKWSMQACHNRTSLNTYVQEVVRKIEEQNNKKIRKDANLLASICITLPSNVYESDSKTFFVESLKFIRDELKKNGLSDSAPMKAYLHNDETTPHVHLKFVPLLEEEGTLKLNFKKVCPRSFYQSIHTDLQKYLTPILGYSPKVLLDTNDPLRVLSPESQKRYIQMQSEVVDNIAKITNEQEEEQKKLNKTKNENSRIKIENQDLKAENKELLDEKKDLGLTLQSLQSQSKKSRELKTTLNQRLKKLDQALIDWQNVISNCSKMSENELNSKLKSVEELILINS